MLKWPRNSRTTSSPSPARIRPWSTKTQVSWSPIASWISTAATAESTPPDRPQITLPLPTWRRIASRASARNAAIVQSLFSPATACDEIGDQPRAVGRMHDLRMEHQPVVAARLVGDQRMRRVRRNADGPEALGQPGDAIAMAHPHRIMRTRRPDALQQRARRRHGDFGAAEFAMMAALHVAAELRRHGHLAVADAEHRHAGIEDRRRRARAARVGHRGRAARQDHRLGLQTREGLRGVLKRRDLAIDAGLAHPPGDQLGDLAAKIDDQQLVARRRVTGLRRDRLFARCHRASHRIRFD